MVSFYDHHTRRVFVRPDASAYVRFHEEAHKAQHDEKAAAFMAWLILSRIRIVGYFVTIWVEIDAYRRTREVMERLNLWSDEACKEGRKKLMTYIVRGQS